MVHSRYLVLLLLALPAQAQSVHDTLAQALAAPGVVHIVGRADARFDAYTTAQTATLPAHAKVSPVSLTPVMGVCGTTPSVTGTNEAGTITVGSGVVTSCALTFAAGGFPAPPACVVTPSSAVAIGRTVTATSLTVALGASLGGGQINYHCRAL